MSIRAQKRLEVEAEQNWRNEAESVPILQFPSNWRIQIMPPFENALIRFRVNLPSGLRKSVFLDSRAALNNYFDEAGNSVAYWEVYPVEGKCGRCSKDNIEALFELIANEDE